MKELHIQLLCHHQASALRFRNLRLLRIRSFRHAFTEDKSFGNLEKALNEKDYKQAFEEAHTLKGVSANLSLTPLCEAICKVVEDLRHEKYLTLDDDYSVLKASYAKYLEIMGDKV